MRSQLRTRLYRRALTGLLILASFFSFQVLSGINAQKGEALYYTRATIVLGMTFAAGPGHSTPVKAAIWKNGGKKGFCIEFGMDWPTAAGTRLLGSGDKVPGMSASSSAKAKWIANKYASTTNRATAAAAALAMWTLEGSSRFNTWWSWATKNNKVSAALRAEVARMLSEATNYATLKMTVTGTPVDYLETGTATVTVHGSDGPIGGRQVTLTSKGVRLVSAPTSTDAAGTIKIAYQRTTVSGQVSFTASLDAPSTTRAGVSNSSPSHQMTLSGGYHDVRQASFTYQKTLDAPTVTSSCGTDCNGTAEVSFQVCNADAATPVQYPITNQAGEIVATIDVPAGECVRKLLSAKDGTEVVANRYCHTATAGGACTSPYVTFKEIRLTIDCPAWASAEVTLGCNCADSWSRVVFTLHPEGTRRYEGTVTFSAESGLKPQTVALKPGETTTLTIPQVIPAGTVLTAGFNVSDESGKMTQHETLVVIQVMH